MGSQELEHYRIVKTGKEQKDQEMCTGGESTQIRSRKMHATFQCQ